MALLQQRNCRKNTWLTIDWEQSSNDEDLAADVLEIITVFSARLYGFIKYIWRCFFKGLRCRTVLNQFAHRYNDNPTIVAE